MKLLNLFYAACAIHAAFKVANHIKGSHARLVHASSRTVMTTAHMFIYANYHGYHILGRKTMYVTHYLQGNPARIDHDQIAEHAQEWLWAHINYSKPSYNPLRYTIALYIDRCTDLPGMARQFEKNILDKYPYQSADAMINRYPELKDEIEPIMDWFNTFNPTIRPLSMRDLEIL